MCVLFFFNDTATTEIYTLSLHDALPIWSHRGCMAAIYLQRSISRTLGTCDIGEFGRSYEILRETNIPADVLLPLHLAHHGELELASDPHYPATVAQGTAGALELYAGRGPAVIAVGYPA